MKEEEFRKAVRDSKVVLRRSISQAMALAAGGNPLYDAFYRLDGLTSRRAVETTYGSLAFAGDLETEHSGECLLILKEAAIAGRTTVWDGDVCVPWELRDQIAARKVAERLRPETQPTEYAALVEGLEVRLEGTVAREDVERVVARGSRKSDQPLIREIRRSLA
jgi:hypothetical protein